jgi:hypothetical protein
VSKRIPCTFPDLSSSFAFGQHHLEIDDDGHSQTMLRFFILAGGLRMTLGMTARLFAVSFAALLAGCGTLNEAKLHAPTWFGLEEVAPNLYVSPDVTDPQRAQLRESIAEAESYMTEVFGAVASRPVIYICSNPDCYTAFNGYGDGRAVGNNGILLSPRILHSPRSVLPAMISHEWAHVELYTRVGRSAYRRFPMWFHEGLAVVVSKLPNHSEDALREAESLVERAGQISKRSRDQRSLFRRRPRSPKVAAAQRATGPAASHRGGQVRRAVRRRICPDRRKAIRLNRDADAHRFRTGRPERVEGTLAQQRPIDCGHATHLFAPKAVVSAIRECAQSGSRIGA